MPRLNLCLDLFQGPQDFSAKSIEYVHPNQRYSNRYSNLLIIPHGLSIEVCYSALAPYQGNVFRHWLRIR
jgi:hypothetical protein